MKLPDGHNLQPDEYHVITDPWKPEWERGVQVMCLYQEEIGNDAYQLLRRK